MLKYINDNYDNIDYFGYDFSKSMIKQAKIINDNLKKTSWLSVLKEAHTFDYIIASGIFNVKLNYHHSGWLKQVIETLDKINSLSKKGFSFNLLTTFSQKEKRRNKLFYGDPGYLFKHCKENYSRYVSLLHDYPLYEFTIIVKKE